MTFLRGRFVSGWYIGCDTAQLVTVFCKKSAKVKSQYVNVRFDDGLALGRGVDYRLGWLGESLSVGRMISGVGPSRGGIIISAICPAGFWTERHKDRFLPGVFAEARRWGQKLWFLPGGQKDIKTDFCRWSSLKLDAGDKN